MSIFVLLDLKLPEVDGMEVLRRIRQNELRSLLPVVILTSLEEERDKIDRYELGADSYIRKPLKMDHGLSFCVITRCRDSTVLRPSP